MATSPIYTGTLNAGAATFVNADGTTAKTIWTAGASGGLIPQILISSDDTTARQLILELYNGSTAFAFGLISMAAATSGVPLATPQVLHPDVIPGLNVYDPTLPIPNGWSLRARMVSAVTSAKTVSVAALGGNF